MALKVDNDGVLAVDRDYTSGVALTYSTPATLLDNVDLFLNRPQKWQFSLGHKMWTPIDVNERVPRRNERPYAGYLFLQTHYLILPHGFSAHSNATAFSLLLGTTGEAAKSEQAQTFIHSITGTTQPEGWAYQIDNQVAGAVGVQHFRQVQHKKASRYHYDSSLLLEGNIGNFRSDLASGLIWRWGQSLNQSIGSIDISSELPFRPGWITATTESWFTFYGLKARYRFNDTTLEGPQNTVPDQNQLMEVSLKPFQFETLLGITYFNRDYGASFSLAAKTAEFHQSKQSMYGSGNLTLFVFF